MKNVELILITIILICHGVCFMLFHLKQKMKDNLLQIKKKELFLPHFYPFGVYIKRKFSGTTILFLLICTGVFYGVPTLQNDKNIGIFIHTQFLFFILSFNNFGVLFITRHFCFHVVI